MRLFMLLVVFANAANAFVIRPAMLSRSVHQSHTSPAQRHALELPKPKPFVKYHQRRCGRASTFTCLGSQDRDDEAIALLGSERIPAALLVSAGISLLFSYESNVGDAWSTFLATRIYVFMAGSAMCNQLITVYVSSLAIARISTRRHNPLADSSVEMLAREFPLYFLATRCHFLTGFLLFAGSLAIRLWVEYSGSSLPFATGMTCMLGASMLYMLSLFNNSLYLYRSFASMWYDYLVELARSIHIMKRKGGVLSVASMALALTSLISVGIEFAGILSGAAMR